jgi:hypothetical protein
MDFIEIFKQNWQGIFIVLGPSLAIGKIGELILANINKHKKWADIGEKTISVLVTLFMGYVLYMGLKMPLDGVLTIVSFGLLVHTGYVEVTSYLKNGARKKAKE